MLLVYDGKCSICRTLAYKIHFLTDKRVEIQSLHSPEAQEALGRFYPDGWEQDFYLIKNGSCRKGVRALPRLARSLGFKRTASLLAEYGSYRLAPRHCGEGNGEARRNFLKVAAASPLLLGLSKLRLDDPFESPPDGFSVLVAEVESLASGELRAKAYRCTNCNRVAEKAAGLAPGSTARLLDNVTLSEDSLPGFTRKSEGLANFMVKRVRYERDLPDVGTSQRTVHSVLLDNPQYNIAINVGQGETTMLAGMARHDLPAASLDYVVFRSALESDVVTHLRAYREGVLALAKLHRREGRVALSRVYQKIAEGMGELPERFAAAVSERLVPVSNELVITSIPEALRFVQKPQHLRATGKAACDCSCSCSVCCGCGCSLGLCIEIISPCGCDCCIACGCGCGCCL